MAQQARIDVDTSLVEGATAASTEQLAEIAQAVPPRVWFADAPAAPAAAGTARQPDVEWVLSGTSPHRGEQATGTAAVYYGAGHRGLQRPFIFADGFNYGPSDLPGLWSHFNAPYEPGKEGFLDQLLAAGQDVILLGFDKRHTYIQANAGVATSCVLRAIEERQGNEPLTVGGVSMGGLVTRYALASMEREGIDHQTATYVSWDSPHQGAWIPLVLQQMAYFFEALTPSKPDQPKQAELIRSPAAQQLLWGWVENAKYSGPVATASPLREEFLRELADLGHWPQRPLKIGVANGNGQGTGRKLPPGEVAFDWKAIVASATARFQPAGDQQRIGGMHLGLEVRRSTTTNVPPFDGAPGGTLASYGLVADALKVKISDDFRDACFVPTVSAVALDYDPVAWSIDLNTDISELPPERSALDQFQTDSENTPHSNVSPTLANWLLERLVR
ncbi:hypothetical protein [Streptomyces sp. NPDC101393]|uniref:hypothetical protein n=1 Tax=Streptomyces sp. NPDC101393 TaxID=3366141 RepID=UPI0038115AFC